MNPQNHLDHYALRAQKEGYPARSVYKLIEIEERFHILTPGKNVLDVGSCPGSWSLWVLRRYPATQVVGLDVQEMRITLPAKFHFFQVDVLSPEAEEAIRPFSPFGTFLSDAAPNTSGHATVDVARSEALVEQVLFWAQRYLEPGGNLVAKLFQGAGTQGILKMARTLFESVKPFRPKAVRPESRETYLVCLSKKGES